MSIDRILDLERQFAGQAAYLDALASAIAAVETRQRRVDLEARLSDAPTARFGLFSGEGVAAPGSTEPGLTGLLADDSVTGPTIADGAINDIAKFASTIKPPLVVTSLPALPNALYPAGSGQMLFLTTTKRLYKTNDGTTWVAVTDAADLTGTITTTQIADNAISTPKLQANAVTAAKIAANTITANEIAADTITAGQIAAGAISTSEIAADAVTAEKIVAESITLGHISRKGANLIDDSSFEIAPVQGFDVDNTASTDFRPYWSSSTVGCVRYGTSSYARTGTHVLRIAGNGVANFPAVSSYPIPVTPGRRYRFGGWIARNAGAVTAKMRIDTLNSSQATVTTSALSHTSTSSTLAYKESHWTCPVDGSVSYVKVLCYLDGGAAAVGTVAVFEDLEFVEAAASVGNNSATVTIDDTGITIEDGALTFKDTSGTTVLDGAGFGRSWVDFITTRFYNSAFSYGTTGLDASVTQVGSGATEADYAASILGSSFPYWVVAAKGASGSLYQVADSNAKGGLTLRSASNGAAAQTNRVYQDVPIIPGRRYTVRLKQKWTVTSGDFAFNLYYSYRTSTHALIGTRYGGGVAYSTTQASYVDFTDPTMVGTLGVAGATAAYLRVEIEIVHNSGTNDYYLSDVALVEDPGIGRIATLARASASVATSAPNRTWTAVALDGTEAEYDSTMHPYGGNNTRIGIPTSFPAGWWRVHGRLTFAANAGGTRRIIGIGMDGGTPGVQEQVNLVASALSALDIHLEITIYAYAGSGNYFVLYGHQNSGGALNLSNGVLTIEYLGQM